jgi:rhodanese-related sulfurtransferase
MKIVQELSTAMAVIIGIAIVIATVLLTSQPANAATLQPEKPEVKTAINEFLKSIPGDYYVVGSVEKFKNFVASKDALVVDVREPSEYAEGHIPNAVNIPLRSLTENLDKIPKDKPAIFYCTTGHRTAIAMTVLRVLGYDNISSFPPSMKGWTAAGEPLEK